MDFMFELPEQYHPDEMIYNPDKNITLRSLQILYMSLLRTKIATIFCRKW